jgi:two-component system response regulator PilR (NtrC family)
LGAKLPGTAKIFVVDDEQSICDVLSIALSRAGYQVSTETNPQNAFNTLRQQDFDVIILDIVMPQLDGIELLAKIKQIKKDAIVVILTAFSTWERAVEAMRLGAYDFIKKPFDIDIDILPTLQNAINYKIHQREYQQSYERVFNEIGLIFGFSKPMKELREIIQKASSSDAPVLIEGESGVGKELVAKSLHYCSIRSSRPFVAVNCSAIVETLLESELFGHVKGAFTGAISDKTGLVEYADKGTLFLDEISEMSQSLQVKLLRLIEEKEYRPVGSPKTRKADIRIISATNRNLFEEVKRGKFRSDLYYRINVIPIRIASLRERPDDIPYLADHFLKKFASVSRKNIAGFSKKAKKAMLEYHWPGNIRELQNVIQRAVALTTSKEITVEDIFREQTFPPALKKEEDIPPEGIDLDEKIAQVERDLIVKALEKTGRDCTKAAKLLNISLRSLFYKIKKYKIT